MKKILYLLIGLFLSTQVNAQTFATGDNVVNIGVGFLGGYRLSGYSGVKASPALSAYFEHGFKELGPGVLGLGGGIEFRKVGYDYSYGGYEASWTYLIIAARGVYHPNFAQTDKLDGYGGLALGYNSLTYKDTYYDKLGIGRPNFGSGAFYSLFIGGRYYFTDKIAAFAELGYGLTNLKLGISLKF